MEDSDSPAIVWYRNDLRIRDHSALAAAARSGRPVVGLFIWSPEDCDGVAPGEAARLWLHDNLKVLARQWREAGLRFCFRKGPGEEVLPRFVAETGAGAVYWTRSYEGFAASRSARIKTRLRESGRVAESSNSRLLFEPHTVTSTTGNPYKVFTPFWRAVGNREVESPVASSLEGLRSPQGRINEGSLDEMGLVSPLGWVASVRAHWDPGEEAAQRVLASFLQNHLADYARGRDFPAEPGTSRLSPYLAIGAIGPRAIWASLAGSAASSTEGARVFRSEIGWREFAHHVLYHFPETIREPLNRKYAEFPWEPDREMLERWQRGRTGYPIVDAGMRELWATGWMHNRVRMIVGSLLVKHLLQPWQEGEAWFRDTLIDHDFASNTLGWQWVGGCGADAAPYFRVFNPITQGKKFDPDGDYVRKWVPELEGVPRKYLHEPWEGSASETGIVIGRDYPAPVIDHKAGRERALRAFEEVKG